jgi:uncharacterized protein involved in exopolysaccharide biosynthesis
LENELRLRQQLVTTLALNREQALLEEKNDIPVLSLLDPADYPSDKSRPPRSLFVVAAALMAGTGAWIYLHRTWIKARWLSDEDEPADSAEAPS